MQENLITWNVANWVTIVLMALLGFFVLGVIASFARGKLAKSAALDNSQAA